MDRGQESGASGNLHPSPRLEPCRPLLGHNSVWGMVGRGVDGVEDQPPPHPCSVTWQLLQSWVHLRPRVSLAY